MKYIKIFLISALVISGISTLTALGQGYTNKKNVSPPTIESQAFKQILQLPYYGVFDNISVKVDGDVVTLGGKVVQPTTKTSAKRVVEKIRGVSKVVNNIEVLPLSSFDNGIRYRTLRALSNTAGLYRYFLGTNPSVRIIVDRGHVELEGYVGTRGDSNLMNILANQVSGVFSVTNNLIVEKADAL